MCVYAHGNAIILTAWRDNSCNYATYTVRVLFDLVVSPLARLLNKLSFILIF